MSRPTVNRAPRLAERLPTLRQVTLWCLLLALAVYGVSSVLNDMLGRQHVHRSVDASPSAMQGWVDFRRAGHGVTTAAFHRHTHDAAERHHHDAADESVVLVGGEPLTTVADDGASSASVLLILVLALAGTLRIGPCSALTFAWRRIGAEAVASRSAGRLDRPPRFA